jgi:hypothetical protein
MARGRLEAIRPPGGECDSSCLEIVSFLSGEGQRGPVRWIVALKEAD